MKITLRRLPRSEYPTAPGLYLCEHPDGTELLIKVRKYSGKTQYFRDDYRLSELNFPDGIAWSKRIECKVAG